MPSFRPANIVFQSLPTLEKRSRLIGEKRLVINGLFVE